MSRSLRQVGTEEQEPKSILLTAGALSATLVDGNLRAICYRGREVLRATAYLIRDKDWGTYIPRLFDLTVDQQRSGFEVRYRALCVDEGSQQSLSYEAYLVGSSDGHLSFHVTATPDTPFLTARCGFAVLHPLDGVAGCAVKIEHVDGSVEDGVFPELIAPWQPFTGIRSITHRVASEILATCRMEGDVFEMEDQRNWSDASYKTYVRPISLPWPYTMESATENKQSVQLRITDRNAGAPHASASVQQPIAIEIGEEDGVFPAIGLSITPDQIAAVLASPSLLQELRPQLLLLHIDPEEGHGATELAGYDEIARRLATGYPCELSLELPLPCRSDVHEELREVASQIAAAGVPFSSLMLSPDADRRSTPPGSEWPSCPPLEHIYQAARDVFPNLQLCGGALSYFTELNRKRPPVELLDCVSHCTCPIIHAADDCSVMQTLETLPYIVRSARAFIGPSKRYRIGPSTIGMRQNPYGSRTMDNPEHGRRVMAKNDPRQQSLFAAAWMLGYAAATAEGHLDALTVGSLMGPLGLASSRSEKYPAFHVAQGLAKLSRHPRYSCQSSDPAKILAVAGSGYGGGRLLWVANLTKEDQQILLPAEPLRSVSVLDQENTDGLSGPASSATGLTRGRELRLRPYAISRIGLDR